MASLRSRGTRHRLARLVRSPRPARRPFATGAATLVLGVLLVAGLGGGAVTAVGAVDTAGSGHATSATLAGETVAVPAGTVELADYTGPRSLDLTIVLRSSRTDTTPSSAEYRLVRSWFVAQGFGVTRNSTNHLTLTVQGPVGTVDAAFGLTVHSFRYGGRDFYTNTTDPTLPTAIERRIVDISGLNDLAQPSPPGDAEQYLKWASNQLPCTTSKAQVSLSNCFPNPSPDTLADSCWELIKQSFATAFGGSIYIEDAAAMKCAADELNKVAAYAAGAHLRSPHTAGTSKAVPDGTGQRVGLVEFGSFNMQDVDDYLVSAGENPSLADNVSVVQLGNPGPPTVTAEREILLDIDTVLTIAPGAQVVVYEAPQSASFADVFNAMVADHDTVISNSWASCENEMSPADLNGTDLVMQAADAADVTVLNASGDTGSTCGPYADTVAFPADDPNATAVGGSSATPGPGGTYGSETWWDGTNNTPPTGQGGFGVSQEFNRPSYQNGYTSGVGRSVPDVVANADPAHGYMICEADDGGCPTGLLYGGTSVATPTWAAFVALLNQTVAPTLGHNLGFLNPLLYQPQIAAAFHGPGTMSPPSDFAHVGLGSPNLDALALAIEHSTPGPVSATTSSLNAVSCTAGQTQPCLLDTVPADGLNGDPVVVILTDADGNTVAGKHVTLTADAGSSAVITPSGATSSESNGAVRFEVTDTAIENVTLTATDTTDNVTLTPLEVSFVAPPADSGGIGASATSVPADGTTTANVTVTLETKGDGSPGKTVTLSESGAAAITGTGITNSAGQAVFVVSDPTVQDVTFTATDVTDGNLPVPGSAQIDFTTPGSPNSCFTGTPTASSGYAFTTVIPGLPYYAPSVPCIGPLGIAFDASGDLWTLDGYHSGVTGEPELVEKPAGGGPVKTWDLSSISNLGGYCSPAPCGPWVGLAFGQDGELYATLQGQVGEYGYGVDGGVVQLMPQSDGTVTDRVVADSDAFYCATSIATDPLTGDLFVTTPSCAGGTLTDQIEQIEDPSSADPTIVGYSSGCSNTTTQCSFDGVTVGPNGTLYLAGNGGNGTVYTVPGSNVANTTGKPWTATALTEVLTSSDTPADIDGIATTVSPANPTVVTSLVVNRNDGVISRLDLTTDPPTQTDIYTGGTRGDFTTVGPDGCLYATQTDSIIRVTNADGSCSLAPTTAEPELQLSPNLSDLVQGQTQTVTATLENETLPAGTLVQFAVAGPNAQMGFAPLDAHGVATFSYQGVVSSADYANGLVPGTDDIVATVLTGSSALTSNTATVTWANGPHATNVTLNPSVTRGVGGSRATVTAALTDLSVSPQVPLSGQLVHFNLDGSTCTGTTGANGEAGCTLDVADTVGNEPLTAAFAGTPSYRASNTTTSFFITEPPPPKASGYDMVGADGGVFVFPTGRSGGFYGSLPGLGVHVHNIVGIVPSSDDKGYFLVGSDGGVFSFGDTHFEGSLPGLHVHVSDIVGIVPTVDDRGYFLVGSDGGVFTFGDSHFEGSLPSRGIHVDDIVGIAPTPTDAGYWVLGADGSVYAFGDATTLGKAGGLGAGASGIAATTIGQGYWVTARNGAVDALGDARFYGSLPSKGVVPAHPVVAVVPTSDNLGYWLIGTDGGVFSFGTTPYVGSLPGLKVSISDIVGAVPTVSS